MHSQLGQCVPLCCPIQQLHDTLVMGLVKETFECRDGTLAVMAINRVCSMARNKHTCNISSKSLAASFFISDTLLANLRIV